MARIRLDKLVLKRKFSESVEAATELIESGRVLVDGAIQTSPSSSIDPASAVTLVKDKIKFVSRAGFKLEAALEKFGIDVNGKRCLDIGTSTGGFTDCFLQYNAKEVVSVDVGHGQIDDSLRKSSQVHLFEKTNAKTITPELIGGLCDVGAIDVSFTSAIPLLKAVTSCISPIKLVVLVKPQFELSQKHLNEKGIVTAHESHIECVSSFQESLPDYLVMSELVYSPIVGTQGNIEFLCLLESSTPNSTKIKEAQIKAVVESAHKMRHKL